eukprot:gnl/TRDRNA2_/TRDRNA2_127367_c0_seq1.p2 gnl/TRDRNA2_/TRDRNA2_127367_c0~~gnl/TRDRNA2_/TRDRNA2_127367_c0_seq1.p2  ORF type:complete len:235 (+),score=39.46 gnl/TRDRNA2_/TRDRNA2_127367_c0_seq1:87-707(+)
MLNGVLVPPKDDVVPKECTANGADVAATKSEAMAPRSARGSVAIGDALGVAGGEGREDIGGEVCLECGGDRQPGVSAAPTTCMEDAGGVARLTRLTEDDDTVVVVNGCTIAGTPPLSIDLGGRGPGDPGCAGCGLEARGRPLGDILGSGGDNSCGPRSGIGAEETTAPGCIRCGVKGLGDRNGKAIFSGAKVSSRYCTRPSRWERV